MKLFEIKEDQSRPRAGYIDAAHKWGLPGVDCPACRSTWSTVGLEYPAIDLSGFEFEPLYRETRLESLEAYLDLRQKIADAFPQLKILLPGASFGPSIGTAKGPLDGFVWRSWWTIAMEAAAMQTLSASDLNLPPVVAAELEFQANEQQVFEFDLPTYGMLANPVLDRFSLKVCDACGRFSGTKPAYIEIELAFAPTDTDIFRVSNFTTIILATEKFVETVGRLDIKGAVFEEVEIAAA